ncbi:hypothetical protein QCA50_017979 [Cerrena zonata]|uniref:F-box domain-containing protein n=1 Tax=Cerrena zonata TaxID=2478898 RepID=A0AAW0FC59_9APHY
MMTRPFILNIPPELLLTVLRYLGYRDILKCEAVCKYFNKAIKDSVEMQYLIELGADGMIDGARTPSSLPTAERLQLLLNRRARWRTLNWTKSTELNLDGLCHAYELVGGVFAKTMGSVPWGQAPHNHRSPNERYPRKEDLSARTWVCHQGTLQLIRHKIFSLL